MGWKSVFLHMGNSVASAMIPGVAAIEDMGRLGANSESRSAAKHAAAVDLALEALAADAAGDGLTLADPEFLEGIDLLVHGYAKIVNALKRRESANQLRERLEK